VYGGGLDRRESLGDFITEYGGGRFLLLSCCHSSSLLLASSRRQVTRLSPSLLLSLCDFHILHPITVRIPPPTTTKVTITRNPTASSLRTTIPSLEEQEHSPSSPPGAPSQSPTNTSIVSVYSPIFTMDECKLSQSSSLSSLCYHPIVR